MNKTEVYDLLETEENVTMLSSIIQYGLAAALDSSPAVFLWITGMVKNNEDEISRK